MFDEASKELHVDGRKQAVWEKAQSACAADYASVPWFRGLVDKFKGNLVGIALGCFQSQFDRCREAANFLNQVLEAYSGKSPDQLSLGKVKEDNLVTGKTLATEPVKFMHSIRKYHSHGQWGGKERATAKFNKPSDEVMFQMSVEAAKQIGMFVGIASVVDVVRLLTEDQVWTVT